MARAPHLSLCRTHYQAMELKFFEDQVFFTTLRIEAVDPSGNNNSVGTGFLFGKEIPSNPGRIIVALVTCRHVLFDGKGSVTLRFHKRDTKDPNKPNLLDQITIGPASYQGAYHAHPDLDVDVAAINVSDLFNQHPEIFHKQIKENNIADFNHKRLLPGCNIIFAGYPEGLFDQTNNLPILNQVVSQAFPRSTIMVNRNS